MSGEVSTRCLFCGEDEWVDILEIWPETHEFQLETCCEAMHEMAADDMRQAFDAGRRTGPRARQARRAARDFFRDAAGVDVRQVLMQVPGGSWRVDFGLTLVEIGFRSARDFVARHHRHNAPPVGWRWGHAVLNGATLVGVAMVGRPVARMLDANRIVEVNRVCIDPGLDAGLVWNAASMLYGAAARRARDEGFHRIITYTLEREEATTLKAAGWKLEARSPGGSWSRAGRKRTDRAPTEPKLRWGRQLVPEPQLVLAL